MKYWRGYITAAVFAALTWALVTFSDAHRSLVDMVYPYVARLVQDFLAGWCSGVDFCVWQTLLLLLIGCTCGLLVRLLLRNNLLTAVILSGGALAAHGLLDWLLNTALLKVEGAFFALWHITLPNVVYTWLLALPMYLLFAAIERKLQKMR